MPQELDYLRETASQTAGPFLHIGLAPLAVGIDAFRTQTAGEIAGPDVPGLRIRVEGQVLDGMGAPLRDALIEVWQADANGTHPHPDDPRHRDVAPGFRGWGRAITDLDTGVFAFDTVKPGPVPHRTGRSEAPHLNLWIVARGINIGLTTRMYFADEDNSGDPVLNLVESPDRRATLIASLIRPAHYRFDIRLQGAGETVFFDI